MLSDLHLLVPALPGFPFAAPVARLGMSSSDMAEAVEQAMSELGYERYVVSAGDVGCDVAEALAASHPESSRCPAPYRRIPVTLPGKSSAELIRQGAWTTSTTTRASLAGDRGRLHA